MISIVVIQFKKIKRRTNKNVVKEQKKKKKNPGVLHRLCIGTTGFDDLSVNEKLFHY